MGTVEQLKTEPPTEQTASRDAIGALIDRILGDVMAEIEQAQRMLADLGTAAIQHTADVKEQLANLVTSGARLKKELKHLEDVTNDLRAEQARLIGGSRRSEP